MGGGSGRGSLCFGSDRVGSLETNEVFAHQARGVALFDPGPPVRHGRPHFTRPPGNKSHRVTHEQCFGQSVPPSQGSWMISTGVVGEGHGGRYAGGVFAHTRAPTPPTQRDVSESYSGDPEEVSGPLLGWYPKPFSRFVDTPRPQSGRVGRPHLCPRPWFTGRRHTLSGLRLDQRTGLDGTSGGSGSDTGAVGPSSTRV